MMTGQVQEVTYIKSTIFDLEKESHVRSPNEQTLMNDCDELKGGQEAANS